MRNRPPPSPCPELRRALDDVRGSLAYPGLVRLVTVCSPHRELADLAEALASLHAALDAAGRAVDRAERRGALRLVHGGKPNRT